MLMLLFYVGDERYTCSCDLIREIVPRVPLRNIPQAPHYMAGLLKYGGILVPVIDFSLLIANRPSSDSLSSRIIIFDEPTEGAENQVLGLLAERVTETVDFDEKDFSHSAVTCRGKYLTGVMADGEGVIQLVSVSELFKMVRRVFMESEDKTHVS